MATTRTSHNTAKAVAAERSEQVITSAANLMRLLKESTHSEIVAQLPKNLAAKVPNIRSTGKLLEQMPAVIVALDTHLDDAIKRTFKLCPSSGAKQIVNINLPNCDSFMRTPEEQSCRSKDECMRNELREHPISFLGRGRNRNWTGWFNIRPRGLTKEMFWQFFA